MDYQATSKTAVLTGVWTAFGFITMEAAFSGYEVSVFVHNVVFLVMAIIFFFAPIFVFVVGKEHLRIGFRYSFSKEYLSVIPHIAGRMLCWFISASIFGAIYSYVLYSVLYLEM